MFAAKLLLLLLFPFALWLLTRPSGLFLVPIQGQLLQEEQELERAIMEHSKQITILQEKIMKAEKGDGDEGASKKVCKLCRHEVDRPPIPQWTINTLVSVGSR